MRRPTGANRADQKVDSQQFILKHLFSFMHFVQLEVGLMIVKNNGVHLGTTGASLKLEFLGVDANEPILKGLAD
jgi:hypothetical protein